MIYLDWYKFYKCKSSTGSLNSFLLIHPLLAIQTSCEVTISLRIDFDETGASLGIQIQVETLLRLDMVLALLPEPANLRRGIPFAGSSVWDEFGDRNDYLTGLIWMHHGLDKKKPHPRKRIHKNIEPMRCLNCLTGTEKVGKIKVSRSKRKHLMQLHPIGLGEKESEGTVKSFGDIPAISRARTKFVFNHGFRINPNCLPEMKNGAWIIFHFKKKIGQICMEICRMCFLRNSR